jgi:hypothetical protein
MTTIVCELKECLYHNQKEAPGNRCKADTIGVSGRHQCDSYLYNRMIEKLQKKEK